LSPVAERGDVRELAKLVGPSCENFAIRHSSLLGVQKATESASGSRVGLQWMDANVQARTNRPVEDCAFATVGAMLGLRAK
jgi:hypothetical protein